METITQKSYKLVFLTGLSSGTAKEIDEYTDQASIDLLEGAYNREMFAGGPLLHENVTVDGKSYDTTRAYKGIYGNGWPLDGIRFAKEIA